MSFYRLFLPKSVTKERKQMISLDNLLKKSRCTFPEIDANLFSAPPLIVLEKYDPQEYDEPVDHLHFREHFQENEVLQNEVSNMNLIHALSYDISDSHDANNKEDSDDDNQFNKDLNQDTNKEKEVEEKVQELIYPVHPYVRCVKIVGRYFTAYQIENNKIFVPETIKHVDLFLKCVLKSLKSIHDQKHYVSNVVPQLFLWDEKSMDSLAFSPSLTTYLKPAHFKNRNSIIIGTQCISPYQILWDMLQSKSESEIVEYCEFKMKMRNFWENILKPEFKFVPKICQKIYGEKTGLDYLDYVITRWCKTFQLKQETMIEKSSQKVQCPSFLYMIDYFGLAIQVVRYVELLKAKSSNKTEIDYTPFMKDFLYKAILMDYDPDL